MGLRIPAVAAFPAAAALSPYVDLLAEAWLGRQGTVVTTVGSQAGYMRSFSG